MLTGHPENCLRTEANFAAFSLCLWRLLGSLYLSIPLLISICDSQQIGSHNVHVVENQLKTNKFNKFLHPLINIEIKVSDKILWVVCCT